MRRRVVGIVLAVLLAGFGTVALVLYVQSAKDDALAEEEQGEVFILTRDLPQGATVEQIEDSVELTEVPERLITSDAISDLGDITEGRVAGVALRQGEQLLASRLVDPDTLVRVDVPNGLQELTLALDPQRAVGGLLEAGDTVGVVLSFDPFDVTVTGQAAANDDAAAEDESTTDSTVPDKTPNMTHLTLHKVLVTSVRYDRSDSERLVERQQENDGVDEEADDEDADEDSTLSAVVDEGPGNRLLVTLAVTSSEVEQIVFAAEFGHIWLTKQTTESDETGTRIVTLDQVYVVVPRQ